MWSSLFVITEDYFLPKVFEGTLMYPFICLREVQNYVLLKTKTKTKKSFTGNRQFFHQSYVSVVVTWLI